MDSLMSAEEREERLRRAIEASDLGLWDYDLRTGELYWSDQECALYGLPPGTPVDFGTFVNGVHPDDRELVLGSYQRATDPAGDGRFLFEHRTRGSRRPNPLATLGRSGALRREPRAVFRARHVARYFSAQGGGERAAAKRGTLPQSRRVAAAHGLGHAPGWICHLLQPADARVSRPGFLARPAGQIINHPSRRQGCRWKIREPAVAAGLPFEVEIRIRRYDGAYRWFHMYAVPMRRESEVVAYVGIGIDVDDIRKAREDLERALAHRELLINELNHRVKNMLAVVQSIAMQTLRGGQPGAEAAASFESRLLALAGAFDLLTQENWQSIDLRSIVNAAITPFSDQAEERFQLAGPPVRVPPTTALPLRMVLHELCTNAVKYGALSKGEGRVNLLWDVEASGAARTLRMDWRESGGPLVQRPARRGFGSRLLERSLRHELAGGVELRFEPAGVLCTMRVPLAAHD